MKNKKMNKLFKALEIKKAQEAAEKTKTLNKPEKNKHKSLLNQLVAIFLAISIIPCVIITTVSIAGTNSSIENTLGAYSQKIIDQLLYNTNYFIKNANVVVAGLSVNSSFAKYTGQYDTLTQDEKTELKKAMNDKCFTVQSTYDTVKEITLIQDKEIKYTTLVDTTEFEKVLSDETVYNQMMGVNAGEVKWFYTIQNGKTEIYAVSKLRDNAEAVIVCAMDIEAFNKVIQLATINVSIPIMIADDKNIILLANDVKRVGTSITKEQAEDIALLQKVKKESYTNLVKGSLMSSGTLSNGWHVIIDAPSKIIKKEYNNTTKYIIFIVCLCAVLSILISIGLGKKITKPIKTIAAYMKEIEQGHLNVEDSFRQQVNISNAETSLLALGFISMVTTLKGLINNAKSVTLTVEENTERLQRVAEHTATSSTEVEKAIEVITEGAQNQNTQIQSSVAAVNELSDGVNHVVDKMNSIRMTSRKTMNISEESKSKLDMLSKQSQNTLEISHGISKQVEDLGMEASHIDNIINMIKAINNQTNLLALNAAIEAARAGEAGKGFAVVADQVSKLSAQTKEAIGGIETILKNINAQKESTLLEVEKAIKVFDEQGPIVNDTINIFNSIYNQMQDVDEEINAAHHTLSGVFNQKQDILQRMSELIEIVEQAVSVTEEVNAESEQQTEYAEEINEMTKRLSDSVLELKNTYSKFK